MELTDTDRYFSSRLSFDPKRLVVWKTLWNHSLAKMFGTIETLLELGAGRCEFINEAEARRKIAVDLWPGVLSHAGPEVEAHQTDATKLTFLDNASVDGIFCSNLLEHLRQEEVDAVLVECLRILKPGGRLVLIQPNFRYAYRRYFDDFTHISIWTHVSLSDFLASRGWSVDVVEAKYMPLTMKSRAPVSPLLIQAYLRSPWKPLAGQMLISASKPRND